MASLTSAGMSAKRLFYRNAKDSTCDLYSANLDGQNTTCVAQNLLSDTMADAQKVAKAAKVDLQAKGVISSGLIDAKPTPDGSKIVILTRANIFSTSSSLEIDASRLYVLDLAAGGPPKLLFQDSRNGIGSDSHGLYNIHAEISPDGTQIAYVIPGKDQLFVAAHGVSINEYVANRFDGIFLRPLSPYGFAIKTRTFAAYDDSAWIEFYKDKIIFEISE